MTAAHEVDCSAPQVAAPVQAEPAYQYAIAYKLPWDEQIDIYGPFDSAEAAKTYAAGQTWKMPSCVRVVTLQRPRERPAGVAI